MKSIRNLLTVFFILALVLLPTQNVHASGLLDGRVVFGNNFTLKSGETLNGDLVVIGGSAVVEEQAIVKGDLVVIGGSLTLDGIVEGDSAIIGGSVVMGATAVIEGDLVTVGGALSKHPDARVEGDVVTNVPAPDIQIPNVPSPPGVPSPPSPPGVPNPPQPNFSFNFNPVAQAMQVLFTAILMAALGMLATLFLQPQMERVSGVVTKQPIIAGSFGLLTIILSPFVVTILAITLILAPVALLVIVGGALAWLFGVIALGFEVGERFTRAINQTWAPALTTGFGTFLLMLVSGGIGMVPCIGWLIPFLIAMLGLGSVVLTVFGTQPYPRVIAPPSIPQDGDEPVG
ncbi:MAG: hypothetical protein Kow002_10870 [Anaerolineales bacterium]